MSAGRKTLSTHNMTIDLSREEDMDDH